jgi:putative tricarboxylic transport membrane protein
MGKADRASGCFWFFFSLFGIYQSYKLGLGTLHQPGSGFLFFWTGALVAILSLVVIIRSYRELSPAEAKEAGFGKWNVGKTALVLVALFVYTALLDVLGFLIVTFLLFVFLLGIVEKKKWIFAVSVSLVVTVLAYLLFETGLQSELPKGLLSFMRI